MPTSDAAPSAASPEAPPSSKNSSPPGTNSTPLNVVTAKRLKDLKRLNQATQEETEQAAYDLKLQYWDDNTNQYAAPFKKWYENFDMAKEFGTLSSFSRLASRGAAMNRAAFIANHHLMPLDGSARYEVSLLTDEELLLAKEDRFTREAINAEPKRPKHVRPVIRPDTTAKEIRTWRKKWREPKANQEQFPEETTFVELIDLETAVVLALKPFETIALSKEIKEIIGRAKRRVEKLKKNES